MLNKYKLSLLFLLLACLQMQLFAVPALPVLKKLKVGSVEYSVTLCGDEFFHYWQAETGEKIVKRPDGRFHILSFYETENMVQLATEARNRENVRRTPKRTHGFLTSLTGSKKGLVILVNFKDNAFSCSQR